MTHKDVIADALICTDHTSNISDHIYSTNLQNTTERDSRDFFWFSIEYLNINKSVTMCRILILYIPSTCYLYQILKFMKSKISHSVPPKKIFR